MSGRDARREPGEPVDAVQAVRALRDEDRARSAAKWARVEATWADGEHVGRIDEDDVTAGPQRSTVHPLDWGAG